MANAKPYFIAMGTLKIQDFESLEEMFYYHKNMKPDEKHFCKLYDSESHRIVDGWAIQYNYSSENPGWRKW